MNRVTRSNSVPACDKARQVIPTTEMDYLEDELYDCICKNKCERIQDYITIGLCPDHAFRSTERPERLGKTLLELAVLEGVTDIVQMLIKNRCDVNLTFIVNVNNFTYELQEYLKKDKLKLSCIYRCIVHANLTMMKCLVNGGFDVNIYDDRGCNCVWHAVDLNNYDMLKIVASAKGADVNAADNMKLRPLHIAAMKGNVKMTSLLIQRGADIDAVQLRGSTALVLACRAGNFETVRILLLNGADPNHVGNNGHNVISTSLQYTTDVRIPEMLINCGAHVDLELIEICRKEGKKFILLKEHPEFFSVLKEFSASPRSMKTLCCLTIRRQLVQSSIQMHLIKMVEKLPLPRMIKDYLLFGHI